jgi:AcrR family transcriptional regulator
MNQISRQLSSPPTPRRKDARVERTRSDLRAGLLRLLESQSFDRTTIRNICARAGVGYATYFRHYPDKEALLNDLAAAEVTELLRRALPILFDVDSRAACVTLCSYVDEKRELWRALLTGGASGTLRDEFARQSQRLPASQPGTHAHGRIPVELAVAFGVSSVVEILSWWLQHGSTFTLDDIADILNRLVIAPILQR